MNELPDSVIELLNYLPIEDMNIYDYISKLRNAIIINYNNEEYQFAYMAAHLIFMTYIYCSVWKIGQLYPQKYEYSILFARPYTGNEGKINLKSVKNMFEYSYLPEKDVLKFLTLIDMDEGYICGISKLVDLRNGLAHANGNIQIVNLIDFENAMKEILSVSENINKYIKTIIREYYEKILWNLH